MSPRRYDQGAREERMSLALWVVGVLLGVLFGVLGTLLIGFTSGVLA